MKQRSKLGSADGIFMQECYTLIAVRTHVFVALRSHKPLKRQPNFKSPSQNNLSVGDKTADKTTNLSIIHLLANCLRCREKIRRKHSEDGMKSWQDSLQLLPRSEAQERIANLRVIEDCIATSSSTRFVASAIEFRNAFLPGDTIVEFCSDKASWRAGMGLAGFLLRRNGADVACLICRMS